MAKGQDDISKLIKLMYQEMKATAKVKKDIDTLIKKELGKTKPINKKGYSKGGMLKKKATVKKK